MKTGDTDLGVPPAAVQDASLVGRLFDLGYQRRAGNRFGRPMNDVPIRLSGAERSVPEAVIDILIPNYTRRVRTNRAFGNHLVTTEVPGLATALRRPPVTMGLQLHRLNRDVVELDPHPSAHRSSSPPRTMRAVPSDHVASRFHRLPNG